MVARNTGTYYTLPTSTTAPADRTVGSITLVNLPAWAIEDEDHASVWQAPELEKMDDFSLCGLCGRTYPMGEGSAFGECSNCRGVKRGERFLNTRPNGCMAIDWDTFLPRWQRAIQFGVPALARLMYGGAR